MQGIQENLLYINWGAVCVKFSFFFKHQLSYRLKMLSVCTTIGFEREMEDGIKCVLINKTKKFFAFIFFWGHFGKIYFDQEIPYNAKGLLFNCDAGNYQNGHNVKKITQKKIA